MIALERAQITLDQAQGVLEQVFGHPGFRPGQAEAVQAALSGRDAVVLLATGSGKSLCYQLPAVVASRGGRGTTLVISPLIALMNDQVAALDARGIRAAALHSHQDAAQQRQAAQSFVRGELELLYVSPERSAQPGFRRMLEQAPVALLAVDEAHCVSHWGHDFRPDYLRIPELREVVDVAMLALTATATPAVLKEIETLLTLQDATIVRSGFDRPNLQFSVRPLRTQSARLTELERLLEETGLRSRRGPGRAIVYCSTRKTTETVAKALRARGVAVAYYHAGRTKLARARAQQSFEAARSRVLVATNAFGMGIDLPDIRLIVHFQTPGSLEAYYQEAGRAGRDGAPSRCVLFFGLGDLATQRRLAMAGDRSPALQRRREHALATMKRYARELRCRHQSLLEHFSGRNDHPICGSCDVCTDSPAVLAAQAEVEATSQPVVGLREAERDAIVLAVGRLRRPVGKTKLARALRGSRAKSLSRGGLLMMPEYGTLSEYSERDIAAAIDELLDVGRLRRTGRKYPTVWIPGKPIRSPRSSAGSEDSDQRRSARRNSRYGGPIARALDNYRRRRARDLKWKSYMIFQRKVMLAIDREQPQSRAELERIPGLGPAKIERFGDDILQLVRAHRTRAE